MKCLFIHFSIETSTYYSHAIAILSAVAKQVNFEVDLLIVKTRNYTEYVKIVSAKKPTVIAFSLTSLYWEDGKLLADEIKKITQIPLWVGGSHINALPMSFYDSPFDNACYGDGENIFKQALISLRKGITFNIKSWLTQKNNTTKLQHNILDYFDESLMPDLHLFPQEIVLDYPSLFFSKGCIYSCNYCMSRNGGYASKVRWKETHHAIAECAQMINFCRPTELYFDDDTFVKDIAWVKSFLQSYTNLIRVPFYCNSRPELLSEKICKLLADNFCRGVGIGIESGSERIRKCILGRNTTNKQIVDAFNFCKSYGLETWSFNMVNIPTETIKDLNETIKINEIINPDYLRISTFTPFPGSPMYKPQKNYDSFFSKDYLKIESPGKRNLVLMWIKNIEVQGRLWNN